MAESEFHLKLHKCAGQNASRLCAGLDPDPERLPGNLARNAAGVLDFLRHIVDATADLVCCYKIGLPFFSRYGAEGMAILEKITDHIPAEIPLMLDARYSEFGPGAKAAAESAFDAIGADAVTINPLLGRDSIEPFLTHRGRGVFVMCLMPNPGATDLQLVDDLYVRLAEAAYEFRARNENVGIVAGAVRADQMKRIRERFPRGMIFMPGITGSGSSFNEVVSAVGSNASSELFVNSTRSILYADSSSEYAKVSRKAALRLREAINEAIMSSQRGDA